MQQSRPSSSSKRARVAESDLREDGEGGSIEVDCDVFYVTSPERDLVDENTEHMTAVSDAPPSDGRHYNDGNITARFMNGLESTIITAREALSALGPAEEDRGSLQEGIQVSQKKIGPGLATGTHGDLAPAGCFTHENYRINATNWSPRHSNTISSVRPAATVECLDQAASLKPISDPNTNQSDSSSRRGLPSIRQTPNRDAMNTPLNPVGNNGPLVSPSKPHGAESNSISRIMNPSIENAPETSQAESRHDSLTTQIAVQVSQTLSPPNQQQPFADGIQCSPSNQSANGITSPSGSNITSKQRRSPTISENSKLPNCSGGVASAPQVAAHPRNSSQNNRNSQFTFERRFSQSFNTTEAIAQQPPHPPPPPRRTDQTRDTESTRLRPSGPPGPPGPPTPPVPRQNSWPNGPPPPPRASNQNQGPSSLSISPQNAWSKGPLPPPPRALNQNQGPPGPPPISPQNQRSSTPPPPPLVFTQSPRSNGPPPPHHHLLLLLLTLPLLKTKAILPRSHLRLLITKVRVRLPVLH